MLFFFVSFFLLQFNQGVGLTAQIRMEKTPSKKANVKQIIILQMALDHQLFEVHLPFLTLNVVG